MPIPTSFVPFHTTCVKCPYSVKRRERTDHYANSSYEKNWHLSPISQNSVILINKKSFNMAVTADINKKSITMAVSADITKKSINMAISANITKKSINMAISADIDSDFFYE